MLTISVLSTARNLAIAAVIVLLQTTLTMAQDGPSSLVVAGYNALSLHDFKRANTLLTQAVAAEPTNAAARRYLAASLAFSGMPTEAIKQIHAARQIDGKQPTDDVLLGNAYFAMHDLEAAKRSYSAAVMNATTYSAGAMGLIRVSLQKKDFWEATKISDALSIRTLTPAESAALKDLKKEISRQTPVQIDEPPNVIGHNNG